MMIAQFISLQHKIAQLRKNRGTAVVQRKVKFYLKPRVLSILSSNMNNSGIPTDL
jgi:hypothetical protein